MRPPPKDAGESGPKYSISEALIGLILDSFISWNCFSEFNEIARNNKIAQNSKKAGITKCAKTKIFRINAKLYLKSKKIDFREKKFYWKP